MSQPGARRFESQFRSVVAAFRDYDPTITLEPAWRGPGGERRGDVPDFVVERGAVLCRTEREHLEFVTGRALRDRGVDVAFKELAAPRNSRQDAGVKVLGVTTPLPGDMRTPDLVTQLNDIWRERHSGDVVATHHLVSICSNGILCPADEPVPAPKWPLGGPRPPQRQDNAGQGVRVWVLDTGLIGKRLDTKSPEQTPLVDPARLGQIYPWLADVMHDGHDVGVRGESRAELGVDGQSRTTAGPPELIAEYRGHGTFIAGVLKSVAPGAEVTVLNVLRKAGAELELDLGNKLMDQLDRLDDHPDQVPHIISLSAGSLIVGDHSGLLGLDDFIQKVKDNGILLVAAAGNNGGTDKFWPAAHASDRNQDWVVSVGALREDGKGRACFSNYGDWVQVYAPGERLVNAFDTGRYRYFDAREPRCIYYGVTPLYQPCTCTDRPDRCEERTFDGMAEWSGTSFATPIVAGRVAVYMTDHRMPDKAREAAAALRNDARRNAIHDKADERPLPVVEPRP
jgi:subtilisin family serine protease